MSAVGEAPGALVALVSARARAQEAALVALSHDVHAHPEISWQEEWSSARVASVAADAGFDVTAGVAGLPTAFAATAGTGDLHVALCAEYDALPGLGHACGHNVIAAASTGAALALAAYADDLGLTVHLLGTPAEEGGGGKILMMERGVFDGVHVAAMVHPGPVDAARAEPFAVSHSRIRYRGRAAHAAAFPERGVNAADALVLAQVAIGLLRQQLPSSVRVHGMTVRGGEAPNAIAEHTEGRWYVRAATLAELADVEPRVMRCFEAGALATGAELEVEAESAPYAEFRTDEALLALYRRHADALGRPDAGGPDARMNRASTDMGNVSQQLPAIHPYLGIASLPAVNHQAAFADAAVSPAADRAVVDGAVLLAATLAEAALSADLRTRLHSG